MRADGQASTGGLTVLQNTYRDIFPGSVGRPAQLLARNIVFVLDGIWYVHRITYEINKLTNQHSVLSVLLVLLFRYVVGFVVWLVLIGAMVVPIAATIYLW